MKMTVADQIKILDKRIKQNEAQYNLDRKAAKISILASRNLDKYEYLTCEDLDYKPSTVEQVKFDYSPLNKFVNKGFNEEDKKKDLKRLKNVEDKSEEQLKAIKNKTESIKEVTNFFEEPLSQDTIVLINEIKSIKKDVDYKKLKFAGDNKTEYDFSEYKTFKQLFRDIKYRNI